MTPKTLAGLVIGSVILITGLSYCSGQRSRQGEVAAAEARAVSAAGALTQSELKRADVEQAMRDLSAQYGAILKAAPKTVTKEIIRWRSVPLEVSDSTTALPLTAAPDCRVGEMPETAAPNCVVPLGSVLDARVTEARLETAAGAPALIGQVEIWRLRPEPEVKIAAGPFDADASQWLTRETPPTKLPKPTRWAASADFGISPDGPVYAGAVERRLVGGFWIGAGAGVVGRNGYVVGRFRKEW